MYAGLITNDRHNMLANKIGISMHQLPFTYLGVPIFKGRSIAAYFHHLVDKIKSRLAAWEASFLYIADKVK